ncbi:hypothetical protein RJT34_12963 [Clitoria ternatea]|uniref:Uncharacterized protein n=1 Tax=Clitoria ternatea TaxID=43366 RepID=A0AAN9JPT5_CLITE
MVMLCEWKSPIEIVNAVADKVIQAGVVGKVGVRGTILGDNLLSGTLNLINSYSNNLQLLNLVDNSITAFQPNNVPNFELIMANNPVCLENRVSQLSYCKVPQIIPVYSTPPNNYSPASCSSNQISWPNYKYAFPYTGLLISRALSFSNYNNTNYYKDLEQTLVDTFHKQNVIDTGCFPFSNWSFQYNWSVKYCFSA